MKLVLFIMLMVCGCRIERDWKSDATSVAEECETRCGDYKVFGFFPTIAGHGSACICSTIKKVKP